jgi:hypothetical protein
MGLSDRRLFGHVRPDSECYSSTSFTRSTDHFQGTHKGAGRSVGQTGWTRHCHSLPASNTPPPILTAVRARDSADEEVDGEPFQPVER